MFRFISSHVAVYGNHGCISSESAHVQQPAMSQSTDHSILVPRPNFGECDVFEENVLRIVECVRKGAVWGSRQELTTCSGADQIANITFHESRRDVVVLITWRVSDCGHVPRKEMGKEYDREIDAVRCPK